MTPTGYDPQLPLPSGPQLRTMQQMPWTPHPKRIERLEWAEGTTTCTLLKRGYIQGDSVTGYELTDRGRLAITVGEGDRGASHQVKRLLRELQPDQSHWLTATPHEMLWWGGWGRILSLARAKNGGEFDLAHDGPQRIHWQKKVRIRPVTTT